MMERQQRKKIKVWLSLSTHMYSSINTRMKKGTKKHDNQNHKEEA